MNVLVPVLSGLFGLVVFVVAYQLGRRDEARRWGVRMEELVNLVHHWQRASGSSLIEGDHVLDVLNGYDQPHPRAEEHQ